MSGLLSDARESVETRLSEALDSTASYPPSEDRRLLYRAHAALRAAHGLDYRDRGPVRHSRADLLRVEDLDRLLDADPSDGLPDRLDAEPLDRDDLDAVEEWRSTYRETLSDALTEGADRAATLDDHPDLAYWGWSG